MAKKHHKHKRKLKYKIRRWLKNSGRKGTGKSSKPKNELPSVLIYLITIITLICTVVCFFFYNSQKTIKVTAIVTDIESSSYFNAYKKKNEIRKSIFVDYSYGDEQYQNVYYNQVKNKDKTQIGDKLKITIDAEQHDYIVHNGFNVTILLLPMSLVMCLISAIMFQKNDKKKIERWLHHRHKHHSKKSENK